MSQLVLNRGANQTRYIFRKFLRCFEMGPYFLISSLIIFVALVTVITLMFSARQVTKGYVLNSLEDQHQQLVRDSEKMDMEVSQVRSLNHIQQSSKVKSMVKPGRMVFIGTDTTIAKN